MEFICVFCVSRLVKWSSNYYFGGGNSCHCYIEHFSSSVSLFVFILCNLYLRAFVARNMYFRFTSYWLWSWWEVLELDGVRSAIEKKNLLWIFQSYHHRNNFLKPQALPVVRKTTLSVIETRHYHYIRLEIKSPVVFYHYFRLQNTTLLSFQSNNYSSLLTFPDKSFYGRWTATIVIAGEANSS